MKKPLAISVVSLFIVINISIGAMLINKSILSDKSDGNASSNTDSRLSSWLSMSDSGSQAEDITDVKNIGNTNNSANVVNDFGKMAVYNNYIYISNDKTIIEYDIQTGVAIDLEVGLNAVMGLTASEDYIYFSPMRSHSIKRAKKESNAIENIFASVNLSSGIYIDGNDAFYMGSLSLGSERKLYYCNILYGKEIEILDLVCSYFTDEKYIYAVCLDNMNSENTVLLKADRETMQFEKLPLSFSPSCIFVSDDDIYATNRTSNYSESKIIKFSNGVEQELPIAADSFQVYGNKLIYETLIGNHLEIYDLTTGEITSICDKTVTGLYVLDARYVCYTAFGVDWYKLYDLETGETKLIYGEE